MRLPHMRHIVPGVLATAKAQRWDPAEVLRALRGVGLSRLLNLKRIHTSHVSEEFGREGFCLINADLPMPTASTSGSCLLWFCRWLTE